MVTVVAGFTALSYQFSTSVGKKHQSIKMAQKPAIIGLPYVKGIFINRFELICPI